jgi:hypothetical protein
MYNKSEVLSDYNYLEIGFSFLSHGNLFLSKQIQLFLRETTTYRRLVNKQELRRTRRSFRIFI